MKGIGKKAVIGVLWSSSANYLSQGIGFFSHAILGRLLLEQEYGLFATANSIIQFIFILSALSFNMSVIQCQEDREKLYSTAFVLNVFLSIASVLLTAVAVLGYSMFRALTSTEVAVILSLAVANILNLFAQHFDAILQRNLEFKKISIIAFTMNLMNPIVAVILAAQGLGVWSMVAGQLAAGVVFLIGSYHFAGWRVEVAFAGDTARWFLNLGWKFLGSRALEVVYTELDRLVIKSMNSYEQVGLYDRANLAAKYPTRVMTPAILNVALPVYSKVKTGQELLSQAYSLVNFILIRALLPFGLIFILIPSHFMEGVFGPKWHHSAEVLRALAVYAVMHPMVENLRVLFYALGKPEKVAKVRLIQILVYIPLLIWLVQTYGITGAAYALSASIIVTYAAFLHVSKGYIHFPMVRIILMPLIIAGLTALLHWVLPLGWTEVTIPGLIIHSAVILVLYSLLEFLLERKAILERIRYLQAMMATNPPQKHDQE